MVARNNSLDGYRHDDFLVPYVRYPRAPTTTDLKDPQTARYYNRPMFWQIDVNPQDGSEGDLYYLSDITANVATWRMVASGSSPGGTVTALVTDDAETIAPDGSGNIDVNGVAVANATNAKPLYTNGTVASSTVDMEIQVAAAVTGAPGDKNDAGIVSFDDTAFAVDSDGYVTAAGGAIPLTFAADSGTAAPAASVITFAGGTGTSTSATSSTVTINTTGGGFTINEVTTTSDTIVGQNVYITNNASLVTLTLPATCALGDRFQVVGSGAGGWKVAQNASQTIHLIEAGNDTTTGVGGSIASSQRYDCAEFICITENTDFVVINGSGNFTLV